MKTSSIGSVYRFADLVAGDKFRIVGDFTYLLLTVASVRDEGGNCWGGTRKRFLHPNTAVDPLDTRKAGRNRSKAIRAACEKHHIPFQQLQEEYRLALAKSHPLRPQTRIDATKELSSAAWNALQDLGLMITVHGDHAEPEYIICGDYRDRMFV